MTAGDDTTLLSVRGEAHGVVAPDQASLHAALRAIGDSTSAATSAAAAALAAVLHQLAELDGQPLTVDSTRSPLTWSTHSIQTHEEYGDKRDGTHGPTGRYQAVAGLVISVRDFTLLDRVSSVVTSHDQLEVHSVRWSVDDDNPAWAVVRADAIHAALHKGQDYATALGGSIVRVEHVADAGLLGGATSEIRMREQAHALLAGGHGGESDSVSLDPVPQVISATIEARLSARVGSVVPR